MKRSRANLMRNSLDLDEMIAGLDLPDLIDLLRRIAEEIELRVMERQE